MTLPSLNEVCEGYARHLNSIPVDMVVHDALHESGHDSVYIQTIDLYRGADFTRSFYVGRTRDCPRQRAAKHKSSFRNCRISTFVGTSGLFTPELLDVTRVAMTFTIAVGGLDLNTAKAKEKELSEKLRLLHGDAVLTRPNGPGTTAEESTLPSA